MAAATSSSPARPPRCATGRTHTPAVPSWPTNKRSPRHSRLRRGSRRATRPLGAHRHRRKRRHRHSPRARTQPEECGCTHPAGPVHGHHGCLGVGKVHARLRHPLQRGPAPLPGIAKCLCAAIRAAGIAPGCRCDYWHSADRRHRAAHQSRWPQEHGGHADRDLSLPAAAVREARYPVLPGLRSAHRAAKSRRHRRAPAADYRGRTVTLLAPLVVERKGFYTDLAKWAAKKGYRELRVDGVNIPTGRWPRLNRFKEHTIELPVATLDINAKKDFELQQALGKALDYGKGLVSVMPAGQSQAAMFSTRRACPSCGRSFAEPDPRMFSFNSKHGWCTSCFWHRAYDSRIRRGPNGRRDLVERVVRTGVDSLRRVPWAALEPGGAERTLPQTVNRRPRRRFDRSHDRLLHGIEAHRA